MANINLSADIIEALLLKIKALKVDEKLDENSYNPIQNKTVAKKLGNIDTALDQIIAIQNKLIGGDSV